VVIITLHVKQVKLLAWFAFQCKTNTDCLSYGSYFALCPWRVRSAICISKSNWCVLGANTMHVSLATLEHLLRIFTTCR